MSRWRLLQSAIAKKKRPTGDEISIHRFSGHTSFSKRKCLWEGFQLKIPLDDLLVATQEDKDCVPFATICEEYINKVDCSEIFVLIPYSELQCEKAFTFLNRLKLSFSDRLLIEELQSSTESSIYLRVRHQTYIPSEKDFSFYRYQLFPFSNQGEIITREPATEKKIKAADLLSNQLYGVDNTGNICVWPSEPLLLYILLENPRLRAMLEHRSILELGGGATALAGLGLAILGIGSKVLLTDGHPSCVRNQTVCIEMNRSRGGLDPRASSPVESKLLNWANFDAIDIGTWEVILGSDCLFFEDFHDSLLTLLQQILSKDGRALFFQPQRAGSVDRFLQKAEAFFAIEVLEEYSSKVTEERAIALSQSTTTCYDPDIHYPILLILERKPGGCL